MGHLVYHIAMAISLLVKFKYLQILIMWIPSDSNGTVLTNFHQLCPSHTKFKSQNQVI